MKKHHTVTLYAGANHYSELAREFFRAEGIEFEEIMVKEGDRMFDEMVKKSGQKETPVAIIDGRAIVGFKTDLYMIVLQQGEDGN